MNNKEIMEQQFPDAFAPSLEVAQDLIAKTPTFVRTQEERDASEPKFEAGRDTVEGTPLNPALVSETPSAEGLLYSPVTSEEFFAEGTTPLAETTSVKVDGDRTQLTENQMEVIVEEVLGQTVTRIQTGTIESEDGEVVVPTHKSFYGTPSEIDQAIVDSKLSAVYFRIEALEEQNKKIIAALKHLGLDTNKHFR